MTSLEAILLGILQGLTEFLPVSSHGHLVMLQTIFGLEGSQVAFVALVHGGTLAALFVYFGPRIAALLRERNLRYLGKVALGTLPAAATGLGFREWIESTFDSPWLTVVTLAGSGLLLLSLYLRREPAAAPTETAAPPAPVAERPGEPDWASAFLIGAAQAVSILPGVSRSGATIVTAVWLGVPAAAAAEFSFLLGIPAIGGAVVLQSPAILEAAGNGLMLEYALGAVAAFVTGLLAIALVFRLLERRSFPRFGFYCLAVATAFGAWLLL